MKYHQQRDYRDNRQVAPHWGAWIEISEPSPTSMTPKVAPHWGAWIEIKPRRTLLSPNLSRTPLGCVD